MSKPDIAGRCFTCHEPLATEHHVHDGRRLRGYGVFVCGSCYARNHDGWAPHYEPLLLDALKTVHTTPLRLPNGLLPREFTPPRPRD